MFGDRNEVSNASVPEENAPPANPNETEIEVEYYGPSENCDHPNEPGQGCMWCCRDCNYDEHKCGGCGDSVPHGTSVCRECAVLL
jgi:hypothetical protein